MRFTRTIISALSISALSLTIGTLTSHASTTTTTTKGVRVSRKAVATTTKHSKLAPKISHLKTTYIGKKHALKITGKVAGVSKLTLRYNGKKVATPKVKAGKFSVTKAFKGYGTFKLLKGSKSLATIKSTRYATSSPFVIMANRTKKGLHYNVIVNRNATLNVLRNGKPIQAIAANDTTKAKLYLSNALIKHSSKHLTISQKSANKKTSPAVKLPTLKVGEKMITSF